MKNIFTSMIAIVTAVFLYGNCFAAGEEHGKTAIPEDIIEYRIPEGWEYSKAPSRWLSPDPTFELTKGVEASIKVTLYGIVDGTKFSAPEAFENKINGLFRNVDRKDENTNVSGKEAKSIKLRYEQFGNTDEYGIYNPTVFVQDEFVIIPLDEGFLLLNLAVYRDFPMPSGPITVEEAYDDYEREYAEILKDWESFIESCRISEI
ncbi:MAG: hypothetical protein HQL29_02465 [Candidatus Omnitrophica bacterium]|nr:hypothetical protein [Candidatus Omnitrophota bacterium]